MTLLLGQAFARVSLKKKKKWSNNTHTREHIYINTERERERRITSRANIRKRLCRRSAVGFDRDLEGEVIISVVEE
jgi:hypothetical protein